MFHPELFPCLTIRALKCTSQVGTIEYATQILSIKAIVFISKR